MEQINKWTTECHCKVDVLEGNAEHEFFTDEAFLILTGESTFAEPRPQDV